MELFRRTAVETARAVAAREVSAVEVVEAHLARIEAVNPAVNAVVRVLDGSARAQAEQLDRRLAAGERVGWLAGIPFSVKENIDMAGLPTTNGVPALAQAVAPTDAPVVERMRAADAIPIARTNLPDLGLRVHTDSTLYGLTRNPWHPDRTAAGSSGGEAAALATGMSALGLGNDIGGSLRNPASACGIVAIRPSAGRVPHAGVIPNSDSLLASQLMMTNGPMARTVADVRAALIVLSGRHPRDPWSVDLPAAAASSGPRRVAVVAAPPGGSTDPVIAETVRLAAGYLAGAGYEVAELTPPHYADAVATWTRLLLSDVACILPQLRTVIGPAGLAVLDASLARYPPVPDAAGMSALFVERHRIARAWSEFFVDHPLILSPTWTQLPFEHGYDIASPQATEAVLEMARPVVPANLLGLPSACVPAGHDGATGLPIGVLLTGAHGDDWSCLDAAAAIEARSGVRTPIDPVTRPT